MSDGPAQPTNTNKRLYFYGFLLILPPDITLGPCAVVEVVIPSPYHKE